MKKLYYIICGMSSGRRLIIYAISAGIKKYKSLIKKKKKNHDKKVLFAKSKSKQNRSLNF